MVKWATAADIQAMETRLDNDPDYRDHSKRLAYRLRELRLERGLSQEGVAHRAGLVLYTYQVYGLTTAHATHDRLAADTSRVHPRTTAINRRYGQTRDAGSA